MATASERIDPHKVQESLEVFCAQTEKRLEELEASVGQRCETVAQDDIPDLMKTKLHLQSQIEAIINSDLVELPNDSHLLIKVAKEEAETMANDNARTLSHYREKLMKLKEEKNMYEEMIKKATLVNEQLDQILNKRSEKDKLEQIRRGYERSAVFFRLLRSQLQVILAEFYPGDGDKITMENLLESLVTKMLHDQNDPYVDIDDTMKSSHIELLLRVNLITRHPQNIMKIRFVDPRY
ncbi:hypothetical protein OTU49_002553 [Cherax quadricarinatus]|uniref:Centromere protein K n=1 Tax=Cherax quadricarinatus TaxID=27406 RepID=A0AAW0XA30_CHEQU|nr:centromere protein K-like [Cherax quadricarinatus]